jgi:transposase
MGLKRIGYGSDVTDEEWEFVLPYLLLSREDSAHREHDLRAVFNGVRYVARTGCPWRWMPNDLPPWSAVYQQMRRWLEAGCFEALVADVQSLLRELGGRKGQPTTVLIDSRTLQSTPESGARAGYDGAKRRKGSKVHIAVDTLGHLLALKVTAADQGDRTQVGALAEEVQQVTGKNVELAYVTKGIPDKTQPKPRNSMASGWRSSSTPWRNAASCSYRNDGSSSEASPGRLASAASPATMNACHKPSKDFTSSPSPCS